MVEYLPGIVFLLGVSAAIAVLAARFIRNRRVAFSVGAIIAIVALKAWAIASMGGFDLTFFLLVVAAAAAASAVVVRYVPPMRLGTP